MTVGADDERCEDRQRRRGHRQGGRPPALVRQPQQRERENRRRRRSRVIRASPSQTPASAIRAGVRPVTNACANATSSVVVSERPLWLTAWRMSSGYAAKISAAIAAARRDAPSASASRNEERRAERRGRDLQPQHHGEMIAADEARQREERRIAESRSSSS